MKISPVNEQKDAVLPEVCTHAWFLLDSALLELCLDVCNHAWFLLDSAFLELCLDLSMTVVLRLLSNCNQIGYGWWPWNPTVSLLPFEGFVLDNFEHFWTERINLDGNNLDEIIHEMKPCHLMALALFILQLCEAKDSDLSRSVLPRMHF